VQATFWTVSIACVFSEVIPFPGFSLAYRGTQISLCDASLQQKKSYYNDEHVESDINTCMTEKKSKGIKLILRLLSYVEFWI